MSTLKKLAALMGAGLLVFAMAGTALAATPASTQGVVPSFDGDNIQLKDDQSNENQDYADCLEVDGIETGNAGGQDTTDNGVTVTWTYNGTTKVFGFTASGGVVSHAYVKGGSGYNHYDYTGKPGGGVTSDGNMYPPDTNGDGNPQGLSHAIFCTEAGDETAPPVTNPPTNPPTGEPTLDTGDITESPTDGLFGNGTSSPADGAWLLVVALGALLASVVVLTPARAKSRR